MSSVYLSASLFTAAEREFNQHLADVLRNANHDVFLPQEIDHQARQAEVFEENAQAVKSADIILAVVDGTDVDSGVAWEMGLAYALGKPIIALRTDFRRRAETDKSGINLMLYFCADEYVEAAADYAGQALASVERVSEKMKSFS